MAYYYLKKNYKLQRKYTIQDYSKTSIEQSLAPVFY